MGSDGLKKMFTVNHFYRLRTLRRASCELHFPIGPQGGTTDTMQWPKEFLSHLQRTQSLVSQEITINPEIEKQQQGLARNDCAVWSSSAERPINHVRRQGLPLTQYAGLAQTGDGLSVVSARQHGGSARAGNALCVGRRLLDRVQQCRTYLVVGRGVGGAAPGQRMRNGREFRTDVEKRLPSWWVVKTGRVITSGFEWVRYCCSASGWEAPVCRPERSKRRR